VNENDIVVHQVDIEDGDGELNQECNEEANRA